MPFWKESRIYSKFRVIGSGNVTVFDSSNIKDLEFNVLSPGDKFNIKNK